MMGIPTDLKNLLIAYERRILALEEELSLLAKKVAEESNKTKKKAKSD